MEIQRRPVSDTENLPPQWPSVLKRVMAARGIKTADDLRSPLKDLPRPDLLKGITAAVDLLINAFEQQSSVMIVADFDSDGATSCALAIRALQRMGLQRVDFIVPSRFKHGYGLTPALVDEISTTAQPDILLTVDHGIASHDGIHAAQQRGMQVLVTDHHLPAETLPTAEAIVNPNQPGCDFPGANLAGVGVCFYLMLALRQRLREQQWFEHKAIAEPNLAELLDLVALGTVADVVPLDRLNRTLVEAGLKRIRSGHGTAGIQALLQVAGRSVRGCVSSDLGFAAGPRLNAAGRMEDMSLGIQLLLENNPDAALSMAQMLNDINHERRHVEDNMQAQAAEILADMHLDSPEKHYGYCLFDQTWHPGVVGLLASRLKEQLHRPVIAFAPADQEEIKGSARSIEGLHIRDLLAWIDARQPGLILRFGGHAMAAGLSLKQADFPAFCEIFEDSIRQHADAAVFRQQLLTDGALDTAELTLDHARVLSDAAPWGQHFPAPLFDGVFELADYRHVGQEANHLKLSLRLPDGRLIDAMCFRQTAPDWLDAANRVRVVYQLSVNEFRERVSLQFLVSQLLPIDEMPAG